MGEGKHNMEKAFTLRFVLDTLKSSKFLSRQRQGNGRCPLVMTLSHYPLYNTEGILCIHIGVGLCVARFDGMGNARASECGTSNKSDSHVFFVFITPTLTSATLGSQRHSNS